MDTVIAAMEAKHPNLTTLKTLYVEISRARDKAELVTDGKAALREQLEAVTGERIAALEAIEPGEGEGARGWRWRPDGMSGKRRIWWNGRVHRTRRRSGRRRVSSGNSGCRDVAGDDARPVLMLETPA